MKCSMINRAGTTTINGSDKFSALCRWMVSQKDPCALKEEGVIDIHGNLYACKLTWIAEMFGTTVQEMLTECGLDSQKYLETYNGIYKNRELLKALDIIAKTGKFARLSELTSLFTDKWWENPLQNTNGIKSLIEITEDLDHKSFQTPVLIACIAKYNFNLEPLNPRPTDEQLALCEQLKRQNEGHLPVTMDYLFAVQDTYDVPLRFLMLIPDDINFYGYSPSAEVLFQETKLLSNEKQKVISDLVFQAAKEVE